jgi:hypothetical protein
MLSGRLIQLIENHSDLIIARVLSRIRDDPHLPGFQKMPEAELRAWWGTLLSHLSEWLSQTGDEDFGKRYEALGRRRFEESVPLHEVVYAVQILKREMINFVREQGFGQSSLEIYAEEELEHRLGRFFDWLVYHLVRGYEEALRSAVHVAA